MFLNYPEKVKKKQKNSSTHTVLRAISKLQEQAEEAQNTAARNDPEITENHSKQFEFAKSLQTNTANTNEYTLPSLGFSICQAQPRLGGGVNWSGGQTCGEMCTYKSPADPPQWFYSPLPHLTQSPPPLLLRSLCLSSSPSSVNGLPL